MGEPHGTVPGLGKGQGACPAIDLCQAWHHVPPAGASSPLSPELFVELNPTSAALPCSQPCLFLSHRDTAAGAEPARGQWQWPLPARLRSAAG